MAEKEKPLFPPEETLWQKYSPHFELPLASATSIFLHGLVIGILTVGGMAFFWAASVEANKPPRMDVVMVEGGGTGFEGLGGEPGLPGAPDAGGQRTEAINPLPNETEPVEPRSTPPALKEELPELGLPLIDSGRTPLSSDLVIEMQKIAAEADAKVREAMKIAPAPKASGTKKAGPIGTGKPKGTGGLGGTGGGPGIGKKTGAGQGSGGPGGGRPATEQEVFAMRWNFDLAGDAKEHARKLAAIGVTVAVPDPRGGFFLITDLNRRPAELKRESLVSYKDAVKWYNQRPESIHALARELQLPFTPQYVVLLLPKEREEKMVAEEARFADEQGRDLKLVRKTWFDFRLRNGAYEPVGIRFE